ncbi:MAG: hypothetical protein CMJ25_04875 [Phycisphaerae bacterium]|nr:hypothetical protein [Phycisphaerae bacterium]
MSKIIAAYGGGFKPPTKGHLEVVKKALESLPEIDEFIIYVGSKERNGVSQAEAILIWDIFKKYLPMKVKIEPAKSPIGDIVRLGKNNPEDEVYFIIGGREGRDDDLKDIENRTKNIESAYPNMKVKVQFTQDKGMSGTNARKAAKVSSDKLAPFLPDELDDSEKEEIFNILRPVIKEEITKPQLDSIEKYADGLFNKLGIDIEFTRHFLDRVNDKRNIKPISVPELVGMFKRLHRKHGKPLSKIDDDFNAVVKDFNSNINIPFAINVTDDDIEMYAKTVMRKKDFKTSTPVIALNENASYTKDINLIERLAQLTQHMLDKGMNIEPLPNLEFVDGDSENAREFLGKTAYYDPNTQTIVLYTEGRHPKDIARSYTHEIIHHIQNLEGRLGDIQTTNTQEDDNLNDIEAEANLKGTMTFRNWTDSLNESIVGNKIECDKCGWSWKIADGGNDLFICHKCGNDNEPINEAKPYKHKHGFDNKLGKDPFGLNQFAREIAEEALLPEEEVVSSPPMEYKIYSDMDGVLTDFDKSFEKYSKGIPPREYEKKFGKEGFWELIDGQGKVGFWVGMPWMEDGKDYWNYIKDYDVELLSSPSRSETSRLGKRLWVRNNLPGIKLHLAQAYNKKNYAEPNHILIDDRKSNIEQWREAGGIGILHTSASDTIKQLKALGL